MPHCWFLMKPQSSFVLNQASLAYPLLFAPHVFFFFPSKVICIHVRPLLFCLQNKIHLQVKIFLYSKLLYSKLLIWYYKTYTEASFVVSAFKMYPISITITFMEFSKVVHTVFRQIM